MRVTKNGHCYTVESDTGRYLGTVFYFLRQGKGVYEVKPRDIDHLQTIECARFTSAVNYLTTGRLPH